VVLQPVAAPSILGLFGFAGATFVVSAHLAGWYGSSISPYYLFPFAAFFGGLAQFTAGMWSYRARDGLATAMHGMWGAFWMAYGLLYLLIAIGALTAPPAKGPFPELGFWFIALAAITLFGAIAALAENLALFAVLGTLTAGSALLAWGLIGGNGGAETWAGWVLFVSACAAAYTAGAMMLEGTFGRVVLPLGKLRAAANIPGGRITRPFEYSEGMPGVRVGQ
jgi:succinate-acetate transporter protein